MTATAMNRFCAICTEEIGRAPGNQIPRRAPLGRDGAMVDVCEACDQGHPRNGRYAFNGSEQASHLNATTNGNRRNPRK